MAICPNCHGYNYRTAGDGPQTQKKGVILVRSFRDYPDNSSDGQQERVLVIERRLCRAHEYEWTNAISAVCHQGHYTSCDFCDQPGQILALDEPHPARNFLWVRHDASGGLFSRI